MTGAWEFLMDTPPWVVIIAVFVVSVAAVYFASVLAIGMCDDVGDAAVDEIARRSTTRPAHGTGPRFNCPGRGPDDRSAA
jgi:hypothetical protein